jgi:multiple sugar transport system permease protein
MTKRSVLCWLALAPLVLLNLFPFAVMVATAVKPPAEVLSAAPAWLPSRFDWHNFVAMWHAANFGRALLNSLYAAVLSGSVSIALSIPAAYALSRFRFRARRSYRDFLLITQMFSPIVLLLGLFRLIAALGLLNTVNALVLIYSAFQIAFAVWMMESYFSSIPIDLEEAAWLEGASRLRALKDIFLPMSLPALAVTAIFTFIYAWNEFAVALAVLRSEDQYTLPIQVFSLVAGRYSVQWEQVMAATLVATVPVAIVFLWFQRYLVRGLSLGAVK